MPDSSAPVRTVSSLFLAVCALLTATFASLPALSEESVATTGTEETIDVKKLMSQAARGDAQASFLLGAAYASGKSLARDDKEAVYWFRNAAKKGLAEAQYNLAIMYAAGTAGVKHNPATAVKWHQRAAEQGLAEAQFNLGTMYGAGRGVARNDKLAADWLRKAADQGMVEAVYNLGVLYEHGQGVAQDSERALARYQQAADAGYAKAQQRLRQLKRNADESSSELAASLLTKSTLPKNNDAPLLPRRQQAAIEQTPQSKPARSATAAAGDEIRSSVWFASLDPDRYTLQILSLTKEFSGREFIKKHKFEEQAAYFAVRKNEQTWYAITYGLYDSFAAAQAAGKSLPGSIKDLQPWVRKIGRIQQSMLR